MNASHRSPLVLAVIAGSALLAGCGDGMLGDPLSKPLANEYGGGSRLCPQPDAGPDDPQGVLGPATWLEPGNSNSTNCAHVPPERPINATGLTLVAIDRYDETGDGATGNYYAQDTTCGGKPYSGITVFAPSFSPPDLRLGANDVVDANGTLSEFLGPQTAIFGECRTLPEVAGTLSFRFDSDGAPQPTVVPIEELAGYAKARRWLGMLVTVENVQLADDGKNKKGRFTAPLVTPGATTMPEQLQISNELFDLEHEGPPLKDTGKFKSVTGVITYFLNFHIAPRSAADLVPEP